MSRGSKIALAVSLALNLFLIGAVVAGVVVGLRVLGDRSRDVPPAVAQALQALPEPDAERVRDTLRAGVREARGDFREARRARMAAAELAAAPRFDRAAVEAELARGRAAELRGRLEVEAALLTALEELDPEQRRTLAPALRRPAPGLRNGRRGERPSGAEPEAAGHLTPR